MNESIKQLQALIHQVPVRVINLTESLHTVFLQNGNSGIDKILRTQEDLNSDCRERLEQINPYKIRFKGSLFHYYILGEISQDLSNLKVTLMAENTLTGRKERDKLDLYNHNETLRFADRLGEFADPEEIETELHTLTDLLEHYRDQQINQSFPGFQSRNSIAQLLPERKKECIEFLSNPDLAATIDQLIAQAGITGEEKARLLVFIIASSYKTRNPLHAIIQGSSGSGKTHLINHIASLMPSEDVISMTRITSKSLFHYGEKDLMDKLILIQDYDGLDEQAEFAFRELQSAGKISSSIAYKNKQGNLVASVKTVSSHFASLVATTKGEVYTDNMSRSVLIGIDESPDQTLRIITYQNQKLAGLINPDTENQARSFLQDCIRSLDPTEVINPMASQLILPKEARMLRRLNSHFQSLIFAITNLHQHQRQKDHFGRLITEPQDIRLACTLLFDSIFLKIDDLDASLRQFFEDLKQFALQKSEFTQRDIRLALNVSKTQCFRYFKELTRLEYIKRISGFANKGYKYKIIVPDEPNSLKSSLRENLNNQLNTLAFPGVPTPLEHQSPDSPKE